jgi:molybdate transport system substrate-binding protein
MSNSTIRLLSAGAAQGLARKLQPQFLAATAIDVDGDYDAVGAIRDRVAAGEACDVIILSQSVIEQLTASGHVVAGSAVVIGTVQTGVAVKAGDAAPKVDTAEALKAALLAAKGIYCPDPFKSTAGIHFMNVMKRLGIDGDVAGHLHAYPNGATAMGELARSQGAGMLGCTQKTEILYTKGVQWVASLPAEFELATIYVAAVSAQATDPRHAAMLIEMLVGGPAAAARLEGGFE